MSIKTTAVAGDSRVHRGNLSVISGFVVIVALSYGTDYLLDAMGVFDAGAPLPTYGSEVLIASVLAYRIVPSAWLARTLPHALRPAGP